MASDFGLTVVTFDSSSGGSETVSTGSNLTFNSIQAAGQDEFENLGATYSEAYSCNFQLCKIDNCTPAIITPGEYGEINRWLNRRNTNKVFKINENNYENISHKPQINGVELTGNKTSEELGLGGGEVTRQELEDALRNKVDKETGKGLSSNDFGNSEKSKLEGIEEGAQKNVPVPSKVSELENDSKFQTEEQVQEIRKTVEELGRRMDELTDGNEVAY